MGAIVRMPAEDHVEMLALAGLDFVIVDCEHGPADVLALRQHIAFAQLHGMAVLVRTGSHEPALALRALDQGAQGIVAPHIDSSREASELVDAVHYPPLGRRGFATYPRAGGFGRVPAAEHRERSASETLVLAMIESPAAVRAAGEILTTEGVDGYLIGAADLAAASTADDPSLAEAAGSVSATAKAAGVFRTDLVTDVDAARAAFDDGAQLVCYNLTHVLMESFASLLRARP